MGDQHVLTHKERDRAHARSHTNQSDQGERTNRWAAMARYNVQSWKFKELNPFPGQSDRIAAPLPSPESSL